jgi:glycosyltransferase involved in cell wall biosynthesis
MNLKNNNRIHFVHFSSKPGGIEVLIPILINNLKSFVFSSFVLRPLPINEISVYRNVLIDVTYGTSGRSTYWHLFIYGRKNRKDIFHVFNIGPVALFVLRLAGVKKLVYGIHGTIYWKTKTQYLLRKPLWKLAISPRYIITSNSVYSGDVFIKKVLNTAKPILLYNPIDYERFVRLTERSVNIKSIKIVYCGRLTQGKNLFKWIEIAGKIHVKHPEFCFEIFGDGPLKQRLRNFIGEANLQEVVFLKGFCQNAEEIFQNADLLLFLSEYESFGNVVVESVLCDTPVIVSNIPSMKEIFRNYPEFLVDLDQNLELNILQKIERLDSLRLLAEKAAVEFRERFSLNQHISKIEKIYASFNS